MTNDLSYELRQLCACTNYRRVWYMCAQPYFLSCSSHVNEAGSPDQSLYLLNSVTERQQGCPAD